MYVVNTLYCKVHIHEIVAYSADSKLLADLFVDNPECLPDVRALSNGETTVAHSSRTSSATRGTDVAVADAELARTFSAIRGMISEEVVKSINALYIFDLKGCFLVRQVSKVIWRKAASPSCHPLWQRMHSSAAYAGSFAHDSR